MTDLGGGRKPSGSRWSSRRPVGCSGRPPAGREMGLDLGREGRTSGSKILSLFELFHGREQLVESHGSHLEEKWKKTVCLVDIYAMGLDLMINS